MPIGSSTGMHDSLMERCPEAAGSGSSPENGADNSCEVHATRGHPTSAISDRAAAPRRSSVARSGNGHRQTRRMMSAPRPVTTTIMS